VLGSRDAARAQAAADDLPGEVSGADNAGAAAPATSSSSPCRGTATASCSWPRGRPARQGRRRLRQPARLRRQGAYALPVEEGSAAQQALAVLPDSRVVAAFHHVSAVLLLDESVETLDTDVLVLGDDREATDLVQAVAGLIPGMRGVYGGRLRNAHQVEALTANLISVNRRYKAHAGLRVTDV
jgi:hypothetical protein